MKRFLLVILCLSTTLSCQAQISSSEESVAESYTHPQSNPRYKLYPTENTWNFLELDTRTGRVWQVQYVINGDNRIKEKIVWSQLDWDIDEDSAPDGRFALYPTQNKWNFLLVDQTTGDVWQRQWTIDPTVNSQGIIAKIE